MRPLSEAAERLLYTEIPCLDHGFVQPIDYMGNDDEIAQAARTSYGPIPVDKRSDTRTLLRILMRHRHTSPFEMCEVKFRCKMPIFVARQWIRHRTANVNEMSLRYSEAQDEFYTPVLEHVSMQSKSNKQGREETPVNPEVYGEVLDLLKRSQNADFEGYERIYKSLGISRELARTILPVSLYTQWVWKIDLHNLMHFLALRLDPHAQYEIRVFAEAMASFVKAWVPLAWEAFVDYRIEAVTLSRGELAILRAALLSHSDSTSAFVDQAIALAPNLLSSREIGEMRDKLKKLGI
jgi:thymidylate synthase (FAD)